MSDKTPPTELTLASALEALGVSQERFIEAFQHPLAAALSEAIFVHPEGDELVIGEPALVQVEQGLLALAGTGDEFYEAFRQVLEVSFLLQDQFPDSLGAPIVMSMLDRVAEAAKPKLNRQDLETTQAKLDQVGDRFRSFLDADTGERIPDTGERLDPKTWKGPIRG